MNNEIKEIIEALENTIKDDRIPYEIESYECKTLLDYITNLQKENEKLLKKSYSDDVRITKAIEYLREIEMFERKFGFDGVRRKKLLNILQGEDKDE